MPFRLRATEWVRRFDDAADRAFEPLRGVPAVNRVAYLASESAHNSMLWHAIGISMAVVRPDLRGRAVRMAITLGVESILVNGIIKPVIGRERPGNWEVETDQVRRPKTSSFPSGHSSSAVVAATLLSEAMPRGRALWWSTATVVATSRIHTRMHHASDVVAGAVIGRLIGTTARSLPIPDVPLDGLPLPARIRSHLPAGNVSGWRLHLPIDRSVTTHD